MHRLKHVAALAILQAGCASAPPPSPALPELPTQWMAADSSERSAAGRSDRGWLADFDSRELEALVAEALAANHDLAAAAARLEAARELARIAGAPRLPEVGLGLDASRSKRAPSGVSAASARAITSYGLDAHVSWEADLWGRISAGTQAAVNELDAARADWHAARLSLAAEVAREWFVLAEAHAQEQLAQRTVSSFRRSRDVVEDRYRAGLATALDMHLARENAATAESNLAQRRRDRDAAARALEVILGRYPSAEATAHMPPLPRMTRSVPAGLPSELLTRRPDLVAGEKRLAAAGWRVAEARRAKLPSLKLTAAGGTASDTLRNLLDWDYLVWSIASGITQPLFTGHRLSAEAALAEARDREAAVTYARAVLYALHEVESALASETFLSEQERALVDAATEAGRAAGLALERYGQGLTDMVTLLESQRRAFNSESAYLRTARLRLVNRVDLYLALGGDFIVPADDEEMTQ